MKLVQFSVICLASAALSDFEMQFAHPLSVIKRYKELQEITEMLHQCLELAENDFKIEKNCLETVFDNDYFWLWHVIAQKKTWFEIKIKFII